MLGLFSHIRSICGLLQPAEIGQRDDFLSKQIGSAGKSWQITRKAEEIKMCALKKVILIYFGTLRIENLQTGKKPAGI